MSVLSFLKEINMNQEVQQAREMGELTASVKATNTILVRMENKLDNAVSVVSNHTETIGLLSRICTENSGMIKAMQLLIHGDDVKKGIVRKIDELEKFKCDREKFEDENRVGIKEVFFKIISYIATAAIAGWLVTKGLLDK